MTGHVRTIAANPNLLASAERSELIDIFSHYTRMRGEWLRRQIIENDRIDLLAQHVLGYQVRPFHLSLLKYQFEHPDNLQLVFRGAGKSTLCTVTKIIHMLLKNPDLRILIASKTSANAEGFLKEIKAHFEGNYKLIEIFGEYYDPRKVSKWDNREIEVLPRRVHSKEASITCVGVDSTIVSKHYDIIISDDIVDEENSRTKHMRDRVRTWYYQTLDPCLEPPDPNVEFRGQHHRLGTRYHYEDLYGHLLKNELADHHQVIKALDEQGRSPWPEKYPPIWFEEKKKKSGTIIFNAQYQCDTEAMKGEVFQYDDCQPVAPSDVPPRLKIFIGADLAISQKDSADQFAAVALGVCERDNYYILESFAGHLRFKQQVTFLEEWFERHDPTFMGAEANAYQLALHQELKDRDKDIRIIPIHTHEDKITRAWKMSSLFEDKRMFFLRGNQELIDQLVGFPNGRYKDLFDALDMAITASKSKGRRRRRQMEPGLI